MTPTEVLQQGVGILDPVLRPHGFAFVFRGSGVGSGGAFAWGEYVRGSRRLELHYRNSLGLVTYHDGEHALDHGAYMKALGDSSRSAYPSVSNDPLEAFRHLALDLTNLATDFTSGSAEVLRRAADLDAIRQGHDQVRRMAAAVGDDSRRADARRSFHDGDYARTRELLEGLKYPDLATEVERQMLRIARERS